MPEFQLTPGSIYKVTSVATREDTFVTEGTFDGITSMGSVDALILDVGDGETQLVPTHMVLKLEVLEAADEEEADGDGDVHYV